MLAELVTTGGLALEVSTSMHPEYFLLLACTGNFAKALGKGMSKPAFRWADLITIRASGKRFPSLIQMACKPC